MTIVRGFEAAPAGSGIGEGSLLDRLFEAGLLVPTGVDGVYGRSGAYQEVADGLGAYVSRWSAEVRATTLRFPPVLSRQTFDRTTYLRSFPDLMGSVHVFGGGDTEHRELLRRVDEGDDWAALLQPAEVVLCSSVCHPVYPLCAGQVPAAGRFFDVSSYCFRHEPSREPTRLQAFVQHDLVHVGAPAAAQAHRDGGLERGLGMLESLGLEVVAVPASDPFFGRVGTVLAAGQREDQLKMEVVTDVPGNDGPTALISANCHRDHFGRSFGIETGSGEPAHSACVGFGIDRIVVALLAVHGLDPSRWAPSVRSQLRP